MWRKGENFSHTKCIFKVKHKISAYSPGVLHLFLIGIKCLTFIQNFTNCLQVKIRTYQDLFNWYCLSWSIQSDILFLIGIKCLTFIKFFTHDDIVKKRRHKIRDMIIIFQNRIIWGGYQNLHDSFSDWIDHDRQYQLNKSWYDLIFARRQWVKFCMKVKHFIPIKNKM